MAKQQTKGQQETIERVMHEYKHGELKSGSGRKVRNKRQAVAIALSEAGASKYESPQENKRKLRHTKAKERRRETYQDEVEGTSPTAPGEKSRIDLYAEAKRRNIRGRSKMNRAQLQRALGGKKR